MQCPKCKKKTTRVLDSRETEEGRAVRRRRECEQCSYRFTTFEKVEKNNLIVIKKNDSREPYFRDKVEKGIWRACGKRPVTQAQIDEIIQSLEEKWQSLGKEISSEVIGEGIMDELKKLDEVAYIRFASVYRHFKDIESFQKELEKLIE
ncbi:transcriptional regulator NrdR [bacterium]|nr:transcriptional regulator NrdR [bacterium]